MRRKGLWAAAMVIFLLCNAAKAEERTACASLVQRAASAGPGAFMLPSFDDESAEALAGAAFLYDNSVAVLALIGCGETGMARRIADAFVLAQNGDRHWKDGRLRNAYRQGGGAPLPSGWWGAKENRWLEDEYQVGSDNGNMAWAALALATLAERVGSDGSSYAQAAVRLGDWIRSFADERGPGGFSGGVFGHEPSPRRLMWKSTEHNADLAAAFGALFRLTGSAKWKEAERRAEKFVLAMWDDERRSFMVGTADDGKTPNPFLALDAQLWPLMAVEAARRHSAAIVEKTLPKLEEGGGYRYAEVAGGFWTEGTAQAALLMRLLHKEAEAQKLLTVVEKERTPGGYYYAAGPGGVKTGFGLDTDPGAQRLYFRTPHLGATAWAALAQAGFNPFTGQSVQAER